MTSPWISMKGVRTQRIMREKKKMIMGPNSEIRPLKTENGGDRQ